MTQPDLPPPGDTLLRAVGAAAAKGLRQDAGYLAEPIGRGLLDPRFGSGDPAATADPVNAIRELGAALSEAFAAAPELVAALGLDALELLRRDAAGPAARLARARRAELNLVAVEVDPADGAATVAAVIGAHGGTTAAALGGALLGSIEDPFEAVGILVDLAGAGVGAFRAGAELGGVTVAGTDLFGPVVAGACRLASLALPGEALVSGGLRDRLGASPGIVFDFVPPRDPGFGDPIAAWSVRRA